MPPVSNPRAAKIATAPLPDCQSQNINLALRKFLEGLGVRADACQDGRCPLRARVRTDREI